MDINPQTREASIDEWWATNPGTDEPVTSIGDGEPMGPRKRGRLTPSQMVKMNLVRPYYRAGTNNTRDGLPSREYAINPFVPNQSYRSVELYGSNEALYSQYPPVASQEYVAQEPAAGRGAVGLQQPSPRASRSNQVTQELASRSLLPPLTQDRNYLTNDILDSTEQVQSSPLMTPDSDICTEGSSGSYRSDGSPYIYEEDPYASALWQKRVDDDAREAGNDSDGEDHFRPDFTDWPSSLPSNEHNLSSNYIQMQEMDHRRSRRASAFAARAKQRPSRFPSRRNTPPLEMTSTSTHQSVAGTPGLARLARLVDHDRKRRRTDRSPQEAVPPGYIGAPGTVARRAVTNTSMPGRSRLRAEAPVFVPELAPIAPSSSVGGQPVDFNQTFPETMGLTSDWHAKQHLTPTGAIQKFAATLLPAYIPMRHLIFTSQLIPASLGTRKRRRIINILRIRAPYIPACIAVPPMGPIIHYHISLKPTWNVESSSSDRNDAPLGSNGQGWPVAPSSLPLEVYLNIARFLPRSALESMRLVSREFERNISNVQFRRVVVSFRPEIYDIIDPRRPPLRVADVKGKGKEKEKTTKAVHDGMRVFEAWGSEVREFAIAFEVSEDQLARPPVKSKFEVSDAFFGSYKWPHPDYRRFELLCGLEKKADEHRYMSTALSNLRGVQVLGLCIDNGLGWLSGPDISDRAQVFKQKTTIFGGRKPELEANLSEKEETWTKIVNSLRPDDGSIYIADEGTTSQEELPISRNEHGFYQAIVYPRSCKPRMKFTYHRNASGRPLVFQGIEIENGQPAARATPTADLLDLSKGKKRSVFIVAPIVPNELTTLQAEWLMETEWAQRAFLSSYCMALTDNSLTFQHVHTLNIAKLSSKHLGALERDDFWTALPSLSKLIMNVAADFRTISKNGNGEVEANDIDPSGAAMQFFNLLKTYVAKMKNIDTMSLGFSGGGERQTGIYGRNKFVLPAPLADYANKDVFDRRFKSVLYLPHVRHLSFTNCWIAPPILKTFISLTRSAKLRSLTLDSVSLSAHTGGLYFTQEESFRDDIYPSPVGHPLRFVDDPHLGNLFAQRDSYTDPAIADPVPGNHNSWVNTADRVGSWADVIDTISPGPTLDLVRYAFQYIEHPPPRPNPGSLELINFISCGYVRLVNQPAESFDQSSLPDVVNSPPHNLCARAQDLKPIMMHRRSDRLLGQIVPALPDADESVFETGFPMRIGWPEGEGLDALEDGQPLGGEGRFTGRVERLVFVDEI